MLGLIQQNIIGRSLIEQKGALIETIFYSTIERGRSIEKKNEDSRFACFIF